MQVRRARCAIWIVTVLSASALWLLQTKNGTNSRYLAMPKVFKKGNNPSVFAVFTALEATNLPCQMPTLAAVAELSASSSWWTSSRGTCTSLAPSSSAPARWTTATSRTTPGCCQTSPTSTPSYSTSRSCRSRTWHTREEREFRKMQSWFNVAARRGSK